jgi:hypothetical protein
MQSASTNAHCSFTAIFLDSVNEADFAALNICRRNVLHRCR